MELTRTNGINMDSWYRHGLMVKTLTHGIDKDSWSRHGLMVLTTPMVSTTPMEKKFFGKKKFLNINFWKKIFNGMLALRSTDIMAVFNIMNPCLYHESMSIP